jgi:DNA-directed RNA polymerase specialized sigma24 family protein
MTSATVTQWLERLQAGDAAAAERLWERYFQRLVALARRKLADFPRRAADEEDVALSAFDSFCRGAAQGRFPRLDDRDNLWHLLVVITARKAQRLRRHETRQKRGGLQAGAAEPADADLLIDREPTPEFAAQLAEEMQRLLDVLQDKELIAVAQWRMEGHTSAEIAARLGYVPRTVERKLNLIRRLWSEEPAP